MKKILSILMLLVAIVTGAWATDQTYTVEGPAANKRYIKDNIMISGGSISTSKKIASVGSQAVFYLQSGTSYAPLMVISKAQNIKSVEVYGNRDTGSSSQDKAFTVSSSTDAISYTVPTTGFSASADNNGTATGVTSLTDVQMIGNNQSYATKFTVTFDNPVMAVRFVASANISIKSVKVTYDDAILPLEQICEVHMTSATEATATGCTFTKSNIQSGDQFQDTEETPNTYYFTKSSGTYGSIDLGAGKTFKEGDEFWFEMSGGGSSYRNSSSCGLILNKENSTSSATTIRTSDGIPPSQAMYLHYVTKSTDPWVGEQKLYIIRSTSNDRLYRVTMNRAPEVKHSVTYTLGGGSSTTGAPTQADVAEGAKFTVAAAPGDLVPPTGKEFKCWNDGTTDYAPGDDYTMGTSDVTLTAQYQDETVKYSVEYKLNGGSGDAPTQASLAEGSVFTVASAEGITAPEGKVFKCWNDGTNDYNPGADYTIGTSAVTLTAQWLTSNDATFSDGQYFIGGSALNLSTLFTSSSDGAVTYTVKSAGSTGAAIAGTSFTATAAGTATVTATQAATATYAGASIDATITVGGTTGANTITYTLDVTSSADTKKTDINSTNVSSSLYVSSLVGITNNTGESYGTGGSKTDLTVKIPTPATYDENKYMSVGFSVSDGFTFVPSEISVKAQPVATAKAVKLVLTDGTNSIEKTQNSLAAGSITTVTMSNNDNVAFSGDVTLKIYCYGATDTYRLGSPITIAGAVLPEPKEITLSSTDGKTKGFATFCGAQNFTVSGASAYKASINSNKIVLTPLGNEETVIPAEAGIIIAGEKAATATVTYTTDDATAEMSGNSLKGTTARVATSTLKNLATDKVVGFFKTPSAFKSYTGENFPANLAYFLLTAENAVESFDIVFDGETAINSIDANDNANSAAPVKVIKNGKLYIGNYNVAGQLVK